MIVKLEAYGNNGEYVQIMREGSHMSDPRSEAWSPVPLSQKQETFFQSAINCVKNGDIEGAESELWKGFDKVFVHKMDE